MRSHKKRLSNDPAPPIKKFIDLSTWVIPMIVIYNSQSLYVFISIKSPTTF